MGSLSLMTLNESLGSLYIGVIVAAFLHGVSLLQASYYFQNYAEDKWTNKIFVSVLVVVDTIHQALISHSVYTYVITGYNSPTGLSKLNWSLLVEVLFNGLTTLLVQSFFTVRVWKLSRNTIVTATIIWLVLAEFITILIYVVESLQLETFRDLSRIQTLSVLVNIFAVIGDVIIAGILCFILHRSRSGLKSRLDTVIMRLILFALSTGLLTSLCAIASLIFVLLLPETSIYICCYFILGRLYANSALNALNVRKSLVAAINPSPELPAICSQQEFAFPGRPVTEVQHTGNRWWCLLGSRDFAIN